MPIFVCLLISTTAESDPDLQDNRVFNFDQPIYLDARAV